MLDGLGISERTMGCPIHATMEVVDTGMTRAGMPAYLDKNVAEADGLIITNRTKVHTDFHGPHESGLLKMLAIGLGKETGARTIHQQGTVGLRDYMPIVAEHLLQHCNFLAGFGVVEDRLPLQWPTWRASAPTRSSRAINACCSFRAN